MNTRSLRGTIVTVAGILGTLVSKGFERHSQEQANGRILNAELFAGERYVGITNG